MCVYFYALYSILSIFDVSLVICVALSSQVLSASKTAEEGTLLPSHLMVLRAAAQVKENGLIHLKCLGTHTHTTVYPFTVVLYVCVSVCLCVFLCR